MVDRKVYTLGILVILNQLLPQGFLLMKDMGSTKSRSELLN